jgi:methylated-DNA-protein-cysteine methyltransferase related protein
VNAALAERIQGLVRKIPRGRVATYGQIASLAGAPRHARFVGAVLRRLPEGSLAPWHRVLGAGGRLSLARFAPHAAQTQRMRLEREGVRVTGRGRVDLARYGWRGGPVRGDPGRGRSSRRGPSARTR